MDKIAIIEGALERLHDKYLDEVAELANKIFILEIRTYFKKHNIKMKSTSGWGSVYWRNDIAISSDGFPDKIRNILNLDVDRMTCLSNYMKDYDPKEDK